jgi:hypothetical protein
MKAAIPAAVARMRRLQPRVIVPMTKRITAMLLSELDAAGAKVVSGPKAHRVRAHTSKYAYYRPAVWHLKTTEGPVCIAESPQHPSRSSLYYAEDVDQYLASVMTECL